MTDIVLMQFGSHVYGTNTPASDLDYKAVYLPEARDILLQRVKATFNQSTKALKTARNEPGDVDTERFALQQYLRLLMEGQTVAIDMLFTPPEWYRSEPSAEWKEIQANKAKFLHKGYTSFAGYCRQQANKYGIKGSRMAAVRKTLEWLSKFDREEKLLTVGREAIEAHCKTIEHAAVVECRGAHGNLEPHIEICNRKMPFHARIKQVIQVYQRIFDQYGHRALQAEKHEGVDWKALMHAVRICNQSQEFLQTGAIVFPRPEAELLVKIRTGQMPYKDVAELIEVGLAGMEEWSEKSSLPSEPDYAYAEDLVERAYRKRVTG